MRTASTSAQQASSRCSAAVTTGRGAGLDAEVVGFYAQEQVAWRDRLFVTAALRMDNNSAFGVGAAIASSIRSYRLSYVISEEPFFQAADGE